MTASVDTYRLDLPYTSPPLTLNDRPNYHLKARLNRMMRNDAYILAKATGVPSGCEHVTVCLHYRPKDRRKRDADNLAPVLKATCDGLVDAGLVADDTPDLMTKRMPVIHPAEKGQPGSLWLTITIGEPQ